MRWDGLWRRGAGTPDDPDNGRLILRLTGINAVLYARKFRNRTAMIRALYWMLVRRYETELCQQCGRPVRVVYHAPDWIWEAATGDARSPDGHAAPGILCPACLSDLASVKGLPFLRWTCATDDTVMYDEVYRLTVEEANAPYVIVPLGRVSVWPPPAIGPFPSFGAAAAHYRELRVLESRHASVRPWTLMPLAPPDAAENPTPSVTGAEAAALYDFFEREDVPDWWEQGEAIRSLRSKLADWFRRGADL